MKLNRFLFIINPVSGGRKAKALHNEVKYLASRIPEVEITGTEFPGHARELSATAVSNGYDAVIAVGGDGTVNEVASALVGTDVSLGIVPLGSGNGLARHLGISLQPEKAIMTILNSAPARIDSAVINGIPFFCTAGVGFDAQVAADYAKAGSRGLVTYAKEAIRGWFSYKPGEYIIET